MFIEDYGLTIQKWPFEKKILTNLNQVPDFEIGYSYFIIKKNSKVIFRAGYSGNVSIRKTDGAFVYKRYLGRNFYCKSKNVFLKQIKKYNPDLLKEITC